MTRIAKSKPRSLNLTEDEFLLFRDALAKTKHGTGIARMATVQFYQALRISEAAALFHEDLNLNFRNPEASTIRVCRHIFYPRSKSLKLQILPGFKNAKGGDKSVKEQYLFPESYDALKESFCIGAKGLIFGVSPQAAFAYRQIQNAYDRAFIAAGLPYRGTHILRHGGCRRVYNTAGGDLALAQQLLGNSDLQSTLVYAQRDQSALKKHVRESWRERLAETSLVAIGRKSDL